MCSRASSRWPGRRLDPRREQQGAGPVARRGRVAGGVERGQDPLRAAAVAEDDPGPAEPVDDARARAAGRAPRSRPARRRCWRARPGRRRGARPGARCARPRVEDRGRVGEPRGVRGERALGQPGLGHRLERERADAVEQPVAASRVVVDDHERAAREPADHVDRRRRRHVERVEHGLDRGRAARRRRTWPAPTGRAGRRGTAARSSTRSSPCSARRRSGLRLVGSLSTLKRSSRRRVISSIDSVLRARRGELDRQRQAVERPAQLAHRVAPRRRRRAAARRVNSSTASASASGASSNTASPSTSSGTWLVHRIRSAGRGVEQADRERRGGVDDVLAVVEDQRPRRRP